MKRNSTALIAVLAASLMAGGVSAQDFDSAGERSMLARINAMRAAQGLQTGQALPPLQRNGSLDAAARAHCADMATQQTLTHVSDSSGTPADRIRSAGVTATTVAENVALHQTTDAAHEALLASDAHRSNMLSPDVTHIGLAALPSEQGIYVTQVFAAIATAPAVVAVAPSAVVEAPAPPDVEPPRAPVGPGAPLFGPGAPMAPMAPPEASAHLEVQPGTNGTVIHEVSPDSGAALAYWVYGSGRWWYYPLPMGAQPGQQLQADRNVIGPPPGYPEHPHGAPSAAPAIQFAPRAAPSIQFAPRPQPRAWSVGPAQPMAAAPQARSIVIQPFAGRVTVGPQSYYAVPPPPMTGQPTRAWRLQHRVWLRNYRRWQRDQARMRRHAL